MMKAIMQRPIAFSVAIYWAAFWLLNGLDKVFARQDLGLVFWYGNDRVEKFTMYFDRLGWGPEGVVPTLMFAGVVEVAAFGVFVWAIIALMRGVAGAVRHVDIAIVASIIIFFGFAVFDVIVGDRAELLEHSTYVGVLLVSYLAVAVEGVFHHLRAQSEGLQPAE